MKTSLKMEINKSDLLNILSAYYKEKTGKDITVKSEITSSLKGYGTYEYNGIDISFYYTTSITIASYKAVLTTTLSNEDIKEALTEVLKKLDYSVESINFKTGSRLVGNYRDEYNESYFDGVTITLKPKENQKILKQ